MINCFLQKNIFSFKVFDFFKKKSIFVAVLLSFFISLFFIQDSNAGFEYGVERLRNCKDGSPGGLDYNPSTGGKDIEFVMTNPVCVTVALSIYAPVKIAINYMNSICGNDASIRVAPSPFLDLIDIVKSGRKSGGNDACKAAIAGSVLAMGAAFVDLAAVYGAASTAYEDTRICGSNWYQANNVEHTMTAPNYKADLQERISGYIRNGETTKLTLGNKDYREYYYGGIEFEDDVTDMWQSVVGDFSSATSKAVSGASNGSVDASFYNPAGQTCRDPTDMSDGRTTESSYDEFPAQKYYLKGLEAGNFNCKKYFLPTGQDDPNDIGHEPTLERKAMFDRAYNCCIKRSQEFICIERNQLAESQHVFCRAGEKCVVQGVTYQTKPVDNGRFICAQSYSVCPYNFSIRGGTQYCDYFRDGSYDSSGNWRRVTTTQIDSKNCTNPVSEVRNNDCSINGNVGRCKNYCQYMTHCTQTSVTPYPYQSSITSPYFSTACLNFRGDSLNEMSYNTGFIMGSQRHFSTPIAQCVKETMENVFYNKAGHTVCSRTDETPSASGVCSSGQYIYQKGTYVKQESLFSKIQKNLQLVVKLFITFAITFYGFNLLIGKADIREKKDILMFITKIGLVLYFATGDAWQSTFFDGVYGSSAEFSRMVFKMTAQDDPHRMDGCQFGMISRISDGSEVSSGRVYPKGKEYLALWDTLDCKIARYLGFGPEVSVANIAMLIFAGLVSPVGIYISVGLMFFGIFLIAMTIRALHIFLSSVIAIILMVFISPLIIPTVLFKRTENIFKGWLTNLISFCFQPMILFAYIAIMLLVFDNVLIGSATFHGPAPNRTIHCREYCKGLDGKILDVSNANPCDKVGEEIINPLNDSVACMIDVKGYKNIPGLDVIGIKIPNLALLLSSNVKERVLTILKAALMMYLLYKFADQIPGITSTLIGGAALPTSDANGMSMFSKTLNVARGVGQRASNAAESGLSGLNKRKNELSNAASNEGKSVDKAQDISGASKSSGDNGASRAGGVNGGNQLGGGGGANASGSSGSGNNSSAPPAP